MISVAFAEYSLGMKWVIVVPATTDRITATTMIHQNRRIGSMNSSMDGSPSVAVAPEGGSSGTGWSSGRAVFKAVLTK